MKYIPGWFKRLAGGFIAVVIVVIVGKALLADPTGSAAKLTNATTTVGHVLGDVFKFFASL